MNYIKIIISLSLTFVLFSGKLSGQVAGTESGSAENLQNTGSEIITDSVVVGSNGRTEKVNVAFNVIDLNDKPGGVSVLNPADFIDIDFGSSVYEALNGRIGGTMGTSIWGIGGALILIDGIPRSISNIRLEEVEQITYLKGANASVLYGSIAANGVILITTKRGIAADKQISVRVNTGIATPKLLPEYLNSADYMTLYNEARTNDGLDIVYEPELIENYRSGNQYRYPDLDYYSSDYLKKYIRQNNVSADFSGGNKDARFFANVGWANGSTLLNVGEGANEKDDRFNARGNIDFRINNFITSTIDVSTIFYNSRRGMGNYWNSASTIQPNKFSPFLPLDMIHPDSTDLRLLAENSQHITDNMVPGGSIEFQTNPIADLMFGGYNNYIGRVLELANGINFDLKNITEGLSFHTLLSIDYYNTYVQSINNQYATYAPTWDTVPGQDYIVALQKYNEDVKDLTQNVTTAGQEKTIAFSMFFKYARTFNTVHNITGMLIGNSNYLSTSGILQPYTNSNLGLQLGYNYDHKYWVDFSSAFVSSTKLPEGNRTAYSPTLALSWLMSEEDFLSGADAIDRLKLSLSGGVLNTDTRISNYYLYDNTYVSDMWFSWHDDTYRNRSTTSLQGNSPDLTFSKRKEVFLSVDGLFFDQLLNLETSFFMTQMDGLPTQQFTQYPSYYRSFVPYSNYNADLYSGIDFTVNLNKNLGDVNVKLGFNGLIYNTKATKRDEIFTYDYQYREGKNADAIFGLVSDGFFVSTTDIENHERQAFGEVAPGDIKYVDQNDDGIIDENDAIEIGRWSTPFNYAVNLAVSYKNFTLFIKGVGAAGGDGLKSGNYYWVDGDDKYSTQVLNRWTEGTQATADYPRLSSQTNSNNYRTSDFWLFSTDVLSISKVQLSYNFPEQVLKSSFIKGFGIFVNGSNLLTISNNKDILDLSVYSEPYFRYFNGGIKASF